MLLGADDGSELGMLLGDVLGVLLGANDGFKLGWNAAKSESQKKQLLRWILQRRLYP